MLRKAATNCMHTMATSVSIRLAVARTLAWALLIGGWLVLGELGRVQLPLWAGGLAPVALWLGVAGCALRFGRSVLLSGRRLREVIAIASLVTAAALAWAALGGGAVAALSAAAGWGVLLVAASRAVRMMRSGSRRLPPPAVPAAAGAALAWIMAGDPAVLSGFGPALGLAASSAMWVALLPSGAADRGCRAGLFDCALPVLAGLQWREPSAWAAQAARWAMLPMMASLAAMTPWCGEAWGLTPAHVGGLHLCAMLLPPVALHFLRVELKRGAWSALAMVAGLACACWLPGLQGLMAASMCHSLAWGLTWYARTCGPSTPCTVASEPGWGGAVLPACCVWLLGLAIADSGPWALRAVHIGLGLLATAGAAVSMLRPASLTMEKRT